MKYNFRIPSSLKTILRILVIEDEFNKVELREAISNQNNFKDRDIFLLRKDGGVLTVARIFSMQPYILYHVERF